MFEDKKIAILGLGEENIALVKYLVSIGVGNLTICDGKSASDLDHYTDQIKDLKLSYKFGPDYLQDLNKFDLIFRTPGLPFLTVEIQDAMKQKIEISSQTKLFFELCPCPIIGVTGTKGKGTTSTLIYEILKNAGNKVYFGGNIGNAPIEFLNQLTSDSIVVLELSSFQLQDLQKSPHIGVVLNIASDHLDKHIDRDEYVQAKTSIVSRQKKNDFAVINADYLTSIEFASMTLGQVYWFSRRKSVDSGVWVKNKQEIILTEDENDQKIIDVLDIQLRGEHNWENIGAASMAAYLAGAELETIRETIKNFKGLEHRLEFVSEINGVKYYNDSFSTTPETSMAAIQSFDEPIILLVGGSEKNADYKELGHAIDQSSVKTVILMGETGQRIKSEIANSSIEVMQDCQNLDEVMRVVKEKAVSGDVVLLSPASASFGWFVNYKERGKLFKKYVLDLESIK
jgi:UDP-N-acetylmuramoylalanine--D-glutamate ligase